MHQVRHQRGQPIVVAKADLVRGNRVVLVHDRKHVHAQQLFQRALSIAVMRAADQVVRAEQHLAGQDVVTHQGFVVAGHQQALAHACRGLLRRQILRPFGHAER